jgi:hypothetical protein
MALNFVAAEEGLEDSPELIQLARELKVPRSEAFWFVMRVRRLVILSGNMRTGALSRTHTPSRIAGFLEWSRSPTRLISALKQASFLKSRKGRGFFYVNWGDTITGRYARRREIDRIRHERANDLRGASVEIPRNVRGASAEPLHHSEGNRDKASKQGAGDRPPGPPQPGGASEALARWNWILEHAPCPQNRKACEAILGRMPDDEWALVQRAYDATLRTGPPIALSRRTLSALEWGTDRFLAKQAYFRFKPRPEVSKTGRGKRVRPEDELRARQEAADRYVTELFADPHSTAAQRATAKRVWLSNPDNRDRRPPWETAPPAAPESPPMN